MPDWLSDLVGKDLLSFGKTVVEEGS